MKKVIYSVMLMGAAWVGCPIGDALKIFPAVELEFSTVPGGLYQIQASSNMVAWVDCEEPIAGDGTPVNRLLSIQGTSHRFFRLHSDLPPAGTLTNYSVCKNFAELLWAPVPTPDSPSSSEGCLQYEYAAATGILRLTHVNAAFNCCPEIILGEVTIENDRIQITESEAGGMCHCLCLYDLDFEIHNLPPGTYTIDVSEPLLGDTDPKLTVPLDLVANPTGRICLPRSHYPWDL